MMIRENNNHLSTEIPSRHVPSCLSLFQALEAVKRQIDYESFAREMANGKMWIPPLHQELCLIIAEMYVKPPTSIVRIRGEEIEAAIVQEVYSALRHEHIELVADNFKKQTTLIHKKVAYLQTALYNAVFEFDAHYINLVRHGACGAD